MPEYNKCIENVKAIKEKLYSQINNYEEYNINKMRECTQLYFDNYDQYKIYIEYIKNEILNIKFELSSEKWRELLLMYLFLLKQNYDYTIQEMQKLNKELYKMSSNKISAI